MAADDLDSGDAMADLERRFVAAYIALYGTAPAGAPMEVLNWKVAGAGPIKALDLRQARDGAAGGHDDNDALKGHRNLYIPAKGSFPACPIYDRYRLMPGDRVSGPAVVEERESSLLLDPGDEGQVDEQLTSGSRSRRMAGRRPQGSTLHPRAGPAMLIADRRHQAHAEAFIVDRAAV